MRLFFNALACVFLGFPGSSSGKVSTCNPGEPDLIPGLRRSPGEGICYPLQYSWASLVAQILKSCLQWGRSRFNPGTGKITWRRTWQLTPVCLPGESPWTEEPGGLQSMGHKEPRAFEKIRMYTCHYLELNTNEIQLVDNIMPEVFYIIIDICLLLF